MSNETKRTGYQRCYSDGTRPPASLPINTLDPHYRDCVGIHHTACVCREAIFSEDMFEKDQAINEKRAIIAGALALLRTAGPKANETNGGIYYRDRIIANAVELLDMASYR